MNFKRPVGKAPPEIKKRIIQVPKRTSGPTINNPLSSMLRSVFRESGRATPGSITKATQPLPLSTNNASGNRLLDLYLEGQLDVHSPLATRASEQGVSLQDIEAFDLTSLYGAREDAVDQIHAKNAPLGSPQRLSPPRQASEPPMHIFGSDDGDEADGAAEQVNAFPARDVEISPATPRLIIKLPLPQGIRPAAAPPTIKALPRKAANRPPAPPGPPINAVYAFGSRTILPGVQAVVDEVLFRAAKKRNKSGFPQRVDLRKMPSGMKDLDRRYGYISAGSELMGFYGDLRLFDEATWKYLVSSGKVE